MLFLSAFLAWYVGRHDAYSDHPADYWHLVILGGVMVTVLATGPKVQTYKPSQRQWALGAIKICSMTSFGREV
jgi:hypothetical protein